MKNQKRISTIERDVLKMITDGELAMRPRFHFTLLIVLGVIASIASAFLLAYFVRVIAIAIRISAATTPAYGAQRNLADMITSFPWWAALCAVLSGGIAIWLLRRYGRLYRYRTLGVIAGFIVGVVLIGTVASFVGSSHVPENNAGVRSIQREHATMK